MTVTSERADYAARVLAAGRRDRPRDLRPCHGGDGRGALTLPSLYTIQADAPPLSVTRERDGRTVIRINNSLGDQATIAAFDAAMARLPRRAPLMIDLTDTRKRREQQRRSSDAELVR